MVAGVGRGGSDVVEVIATSRRRRVVEMGSRRIMVVPLIVLTLSLREDRGGTTWTGSGCIG
jgi:hypothetical protein